MCNGKSDFTEAVECYHMATKFGKIAKVALTAVLYIFVSPKVHSLVFVNHCVHVHTVQQQQRLRTSTTKFQTVYE